MAILGYSVLWVLQDVCIINCMTPSRHVILRCECFMYPPSQDAGFGLRSYLSVCGMHYFPLAFDIVLWSRCHAVGLWESVFAIPSGMLQCRG